MNDTQSTRPQRPSHEQWEAVRFLISKLWFEEEKILPNIVIHLRNDHGLYISPRTLKKKLQEWGLIKKMNPKDAEDLLAAQARLDALGHEGLLLLRGRYFVDIRKVHDYQIRREKARGDGSIEHRDGMDPTSSNVVTVLWPRRQMPEAPEPPIALLGKLESVLREIQFLLRGAKEASMCVPGTTALEWKTSTTEPESLERHLYGSIWESTRALKDGDSSWAGLCWQSALLTLEDLIWETDPNIWISFVRCCVRLHRYQAGEVAQHFLFKLRWLRDVLPGSAPHRALVFALTDLPLSDLVDGCVFALEVNLRNVELLWPLESGCQIEYQLHLNDERLRQGLDVPKGMPCIYGPKALSGQATWQDNSIQCDWLYTCVLQWEYDEAETIARNTISQLEREQNSHAEDEQGKISSALLAYWYSLLGAVQYYQDDHAKSHASYLRCLQYHQESEKVQAHDALHPGELHRILVLLQWLNTTMIQSQVTITSELVIHDQKLKEEFNQQLQDKEDTPFRRRSHRSFKLPTKVEESKEKETKEQKKRDKNAEKEVKRKKKEKREEKQVQRNNIMRSIPDRSRTGRRYVFVSPKHQSSGISAAVTTGQRRTGGGQKLWKPCKPTVPWP